MSIVTSKGVICICLWIFFLSCSRQTNEYNISIAHNDGKILVKGMLVNGKKEGMWIEYHDNHSKEVAESYIKGRLHGEFYTFWSDSVIFHHGWYNDGLLHGRFEQHSDNGTLAYKGQYKYGKKYGIWEEYTYKGMLNRIVEYDENEKKKIIKDYCLEPPAPGEIRNCE